MVKIPEKIVMAVRVGDEEVVFTLRKPTNQELNEYLASRYEVGRRNRLKDNSLQARCEFFDLLLESVENLEDAQGPVTVERKDAIPVTWKSDIVFRAYEDHEIDTKN